jgi:serine/threonine-protein kinase
MGPLEPQSPPAGCPSGETLLAFSRGDLPEPDLEAVADHVSACGRCLSTLSALHVQGAGEGLEARLRQCLVTPGPPAAVAGLRTLTGPATGHDDRREPAPPAAADLPARLRALIGTTVGRYTLVDLIGWGGMGAVFRATQPPLRSTVALKMLLAGAYVSPDRVTRLCTEGKALARLRHPNVVGLYHFDEHDGLPYFTMELTDGGSLAARLDGRPLDPRAAAELVRTLAGAVEFAHQNKVVHRDLKPGNVLFARDGTPKIADFGLAKLLDAADGTLTATDAILGSPSYMAPEQAAGRTAEVGPRTDVYGLGAILYETLTGSPPHLGADHRDTLRLVQEAQPAPPSQGRPGVPRDLEAICLRCLEKLPARRYPSAQALADDLGRWLRGEQPQAVPGWGRWLVGKARRHAVAIAAAVVLVGVGLALYWFDPDRPARSLRAELDRDREVTPLRETGRPAWFRVRAGDENTTAVTGRDGTFTVSSWPVCLVELVPDSRHDRYRLTVQVRHENSGDGGLVGAYVARRGFPGPTRDTDLYVGMAFNDVRSPAQAIPAHLAPKVALKDPPDPSVRLGPGIVGEFAAGLTWEVYPGGVAGPRYKPRGIAGDTWRELELVVTPEEITGSWDGKPFGPLTARDATVGFRIQCTDAVNGHPDDPLLVNIDPVYTPRGGVGLFVFRGSASFRSAVITPLRGAQ